MRCGTPFPSAASAWGRAQLENLLGSEAPMTKLFVGFCCLVFALQTFDSRDLSILSAGPRWVILRWGALVPVIGVIEPWRILSATFVHFGVMHIVFNMMATIHLGKMLEGKVGSARFIVTVIVTAIAGFAASQAWDLNTGAPQIPTGGASGGISGLIGALVGNLYARRDPAYKQVFIQFVIYAVLMALLWSVNNAAHAGGFVAGVPFGYLFYKENRPWRLAWVFRIAAALCIVGSVASVVLCATSDVWRVQKAIEMQRMGR